MTTYAFTGHRPNKLGGYSETAHHKLIDIAISFIQSTSPDDEFISGMALGWDQAVAAACIHLKRYWITAIPFEGQEKAWPDSSQRYYHSLLSLANEQHIVCDGGYAAWKMQRRNEWMVDHSDHLIALWDGSAGGTGNCILYAKRVNKPITNLYEQLH